MVICLEQGEDLHMAQLMPLPLTVSCFSKIQIGFTFLVPAHPGSPGKGAVKRAYIPESVFINSLIQFLFNHHSAPELFHTALGSLVPDPRVKALRGTAKD